MTRINNVDIDKVVVYGGQFLVVLLLTFFKIRITTFSSPLAIKLKCFFIFINNFPQKEEFCEKMWYYNLIRL